MPLGKDDDVACGEANGRIIAEFDVALTFRNQMEDHHALGTRLQ